MCLCLGRKKERKRVIQAPPEKQWHLQVSCILLVRHARAIQVWVEISTQIILIQFLQPKKITIIMLKTLCFFFRTYIRLWMRSIAGGSSESWHLRLVPPFVLAQPVSLTYITWWGGPPLIYTVTYIPNVVATTTSPYYPAAAATSRISRVAWVWHWAWTWMGERLCLGMAGTE